MKISDMLWQLANMPSENFRQQAGPVATESYYMMMSKGQWCVVTA